MLQILVLTSLTVSSWPEDWDLSLVGEPPSSLLKLDRRPSDRLGNLTPLFDRAMVLT